MARLAVVPDPVRTLAFQKLISTLLGAQQGWWMTEPIRLVQTNLRETDAAVDPY